MYFKIKTQFRNMYENTQFGGCKGEPLTTLHALECQRWIGRNGLVTYIPHYEDLNEEDDEEPVFLDQIIRRYIIILSQL